MHTAKEWIDEFRRLSALPVPKRARGIRFNRVGFWSINAFLVAIGVSAPLLLQVRARSSFLFLLAGYVVVWFVWGLPEYFYHEAKRRKRYLRRHYPRVYKAILALREQGEKTSFNVPVLHIEGNTYFLVSYFFRQPWWQIRPWVKLRGWVVFDEQGRVIQDAAVFAKAFITMAYADIGAVEVQKRQTGELGELRFALRKYLPRAERLFQRRRRWFEENGLGYQWMEITSRFPLFYQAVKDAMAFYPVNDKFLEAIGYSFGYEFWYEDAVHMEKVRRAFGEYMRLRYKEELMTALLKLEEIWKALSQRRSWTKYVLDMLGRSLKQVWQLTYYALDSGIPTMMEWEAYVTRVEIAKRKGLPLLGKQPLPEEYPWKGALYHDMPFREE